MSRLLGVLPLLALVIALGSNPARAQNSACYDYLDRTTYDSGFSQTDFESISDTKIENGRLVLDTDERQLGDTNRISVNTRQRLTAHYVYESAGASHSFGVFLWNDAVKKYTKEDGYHYTESPCSSAADCDPGMSCQFTGGNQVCAYPRYTLRDDGTAGGIADNGVFDWFEDLYVKQCPTCTPLLIQSPYEDGGDMAHVPNLLETLASNQGAWIFKLADDDTDTTVYGDLAPVRDKSATKDGIPDYDVNGDGVIDELDRSAALGTFDAGSELVFYLVVYYKQQVRESSVGSVANSTCTPQLVCPDTCDDAKCAYCIQNCPPDQWSNWCAHRNRCGDCQPYQKQVCTPGEVAARIIPYFSKRVLNPDYLDTGTGWKDVDIGCPFGSTCGGYPGWVDGETLTRLRDLYGLDLPHEVKRIHYRTDGQSDHIFVGAPSTMPNWWILGFEDLYDHGDKDFNDLVFLIFRTNGGETVSKTVVDELSAEAKANSTITKVHIKKEDYIPSPPCSTDPDEVRIEYYISVGSDQGGQPEWIRVEFPPSSPDETTLDLQDLGLAGTDLRWKAVIVSNDHDCKPEVRGVDIGYEALQHGEYLFSSPVALANAIWRGGTETLSSDWNVTGGDYSNRGRLRMIQLYDPQTPDQPDSVRIWDAGEVLAGMNPDDRKVFSHVNGTMTPLDQTAPPSVLSSVLSPADRDETLNGQRVYDMDGDGDCDDDDARWIIEWTRGWEQPQSLQRAWKLGAVNRSTPAVVHVPGEPEWLDKTAIPVDVRVAYRDWSQTPEIAERQTIAVVGAQDGLLHAFDAGNFRWGDNPDTGVFEHRGYFEFANGRPDYGSGKEVWAYAPPSLIGYLKNNRVRNYFPEINRPAMVDGSIALSDVYGRFIDLPSQNRWKTAIFFSMGRQHPYLSALDVTRPGSPGILWTEDWTDADFQGTNAAPTVAWIPGIPGPDPQFALATTSGLSGTPGDVFLYLIDPTTGQTLKKVRLNQGGGDASAKAYGAAGRPVLIDKNQDGVTDRIYVADTNGRIWRHDLDGATGDSCLLASVGQPIYSTPAVSVRQDSQMDFIVSLYFGTGDRPDVDDTPQPPYRFYGLIDDDLSSQCTPAELLFQYDLPSDEKAWADPVIAAERVYLGTATGDKAHLCDEDPSNPGHIYAFELDPDTLGVARLAEEPVSAGGNVITGMLVFDQHVITNTVGGKTTIVGGSSWNNISGLMQSNNMMDRYWNEVINKY